jgi:uncharacterized protein YbjT (DUF2867 family)
MQHELVAVTGATGFVGQALLGRLRLRGYEVRALARSPQPVREGVEWVAGDLADRAALARLVEGASAVIHVAGVVNAPDAAGFEAGNVTGTLTVVEEAAKAGVPRFIHVSSLSAREPQLSAYGASKLRGERMVMASGLDWTVVRAPAIYGPRDTEMFELFKLARRGVVPLPPQGHLSVIHVDDLARLLLALLPGGEAVTRQVFEPDDGRPGGWKHSELARAIGWAVGRRIWPLHMPPWMLRIGARLDGLLRGRKAKLTADRVGYMCHADWRVTLEGRIPETVWKPKVPTREGLRSAVDWYRLNGWLK